MSTLTQTPPKIGSQDTAHPIFRDSIKNFIPRNQTHRHSTHNSPSSVDDDGDDDDDVTDYIVYFLPGNPGLIGYYLQFLQSLTNSIKPHPKARFVLASRSIKGLEVYPQDYGLPTNYSWANSSCSLDQQEKFAYGEICEIARQMEIEHERSSSTPALLRTGSTTTPTKRKKRNYRCILVAHSMGSYLSMQITNHLFEKAREEERKWESFESPSSSSLDPFTLTVSAQILLFPALLDISQSKSGKPFTFLMSWRISWVVVYLAAFLSSIIPTIVLWSIVQFVALVMRSDSISHPVTWNFIQTANGRGITRAMTLGVSEMIEIKGDRWPATVWGLGPKKQAVTAGQAQPLPPTTHQFPPSFSPQVYYFFAQDDGWVSSPIRDRMIAEKQAKSYLQQRANPGQFHRPLFEVDNTGIPHHFCLDETWSNQVAGKVANFIDTVVEQELS